MRYFGGGRMDGFRVIAEKKLSFETGWHMQAPIVDSEKSGDYEIAVVRIGETQKRFLKTADFYKGNWVADVKSGRNEGGIPL